jgi:hypothetical protein
MIRPIRASLIASTIALSFGVLSLGCSSSTTNPAAGGDGGTGSDGGGGDGSVAAGMAKQKGKMVELGQTVGVVGATVDLGGHSAVTMGAPSKGAYEIAVPINTPYFMTVTEPGHVKLIEQEWQLSADYDRMTTGMVDVGTQGMLQGALPGFDATKGVLGVGITKSAGGACASEAGATIALAVPGNSKIRYFKAGFPDGMTMAVLDGQNTPSAVIYNIDVGADLTLAPTAPTGCTLDTFPHTEGAITYTGKAKVEAGASAFTRVFVK